MRSARRPMGSMISKKVMAKAEASQPVLAIEPPRAVTWPGSRADTMPTPSINRNTERFMANCDLDSFMKCTSRAAVRNARRNRGGPTAGDAAGIQ